MKTHYLAIIAVLTASASAYADDGEALFNSKKCSTCHKLEVKTVGPTLKALSAKYADDKDALPRLEAKVRSGGSGVWGPMMMPSIPVSMASNEEIKTIVTWMLSHK